MVRSESEITTKLLEKQLRDSETMWWWFKHLVIPLLIIALVLVVWITVYWMLAVEKVQTQSQGCTVEKPCVMLASYHSEKHPLSASLNFTECHETFFSCDLDTGKCLTSSDCRVSKDG